MSAPGRRSSLVVGDVRHRRHAPVVNAFRYGVYWALLDVDELPELDRQVRGFGYNRRALTGFRDTDHLGALDAPVRDKLATWLADRGQQLPDGPVLVLCNLRVLGFVFDPVSWWFCHDRDGSLRLVVAEVRNTFGESHSYLLDDLEVVGERQVAARGEKVLHVSPFLAVAGHRYRFRWRPPAADRPGAGELVAAHIDVEDDDGVVLDATQSGRRVPFGSRALASVLWRYPLVTLRTVWLIHRQALRLWRRRVPFHRKPVTPPPDGYPRAIPHARSDERPDEPRRDHAVDAARRRREHAS